MCLDVEIKDKEVILKSATEQSRFIFKVTIIRSATKTSTERMEAIGQSSKNFLVLKENCQS